MPPSRSSRRRRRGRASKNDRDAAAAGAETDEDDTPASRPGVTAAVGSSCCGTAWPRRPLPTVHEDVGCVASNT
eukprot:363634-Chlamydomonas_euryale.AAC.11